jgi:hypothetical protein
MQRTDTDQLRYPFSMLKTVGELIVALQRFDPNADVVTFLDSRPDGIILSVDAYDCDNIVTLKIRSTRPRRTLPHAKMALPPLQAR